MSKMQFFIAAAILCMCHQSLADVFDESSEADACLIIATPGQSAPFEIADSVIQTAALPPDDGKSNYGDLIYDDETGYGRNAYEDIVTLSTTYDVEKDLQWHVVLKKGMKIYSVRAVNVGRQRVFVQRIDVSHAGEALISFTVPAKADPRLLVHIYAE